MSKKDVDFTGTVIGMILLGVILLPFVVIYLIIKLILFITVKTMNNRKQKTKYSIEISGDDKEILHKIDNMDGHEFERFIAEVLKRNGFKNVYTTKSSGDFGADIIGELGSVRYAFQCKRFESKIGPKPIGEVLRGMNHYKCQKGAVITNNYFTKQACQESRVNNVELWDRLKVLELCRYNKKINNQEDKQAYSQVDKQ